MKTPSDPNVTEQPKCVARGSLRRMVQRWAKAWSVKRRDRLAALKRQRAKQKLDKLEAHLESLMLSLPSGYERRQCNNDLFRVRAMRAMSGI